MSGKFALPFVLAGLLGVVGLTFWSGNVTATEDLKVKAGDEAPTFSAVALDGKDVSLDDYKSSEVVVVIFTCNGCPVAVAYEDRFNEFAQKYKEKKVSMVAINCNKGEDIEAMKRRVEEKGLVYDYVSDASGNSARAYGAQVTPHCFVLNSKREVVYQGAFDDSQSKPTEHYLIDAVEATLAGKKVPVDFKKAFGCGIKLRPAQD